jgi:hypothetical protein
MKSWNKTGRNRRIRNRLRIIMWTTEILGMSKGRRTIRKENLKFSKEKELGLGESAKDGRRSDLIV